MRYLRSSLASTLPPAAVLALAGSACGLLSPHASASILNWVGTSGSASVSGKWNPTAVPSAADDLVFNVNTPRSVTFDSSTIASRSQTFRASNWTVDFTSPHTIGAGGIVLGPTAGDAVAVLFGLGTVTCNGPMILGQAPSTTTTFNLAGTFARINLNSILTIGDESPATLNLTSGGRIDVTGVTRLSNGSGSGDLTISGHNGGTEPSQLNCGSSLLCTAGTIDVLAGGRLTVDGLFRVAGSTSAFPCAVTVSGIGVGGSEVIASGGLDIARNTTSTVSGGTASFEVGASGIVVSQGPTVVGDPDGGSGTLRLTGGTFSARAGLAFDPVNGHLDFQRGTLAVSGALVPPPGSLTIQSSTTTDLAHLQFDSGGSMTMSSGSLFVGSQRQGRLFLQSGSSVTVPNCVLGNSVGGNGLLSLNGVGATMNAGAFCTVGGAGTGTLTVAAGTTLTAVDLSLGAAATGAGTATINGTVTLSDDLFVGGNAGAGGTAAGSGAVTIFSPGILSFESGTIFGGGFVRVNDGGTVNFTGTLSLPATRSQLIVGSATIHGGTLSLLNGDLTLTDGADIDADVVTSSPASIINVTGSVSLGRASSLSGVVNANLNLGSNSVTLRDADLASVDTVTMNGGTIDAPNGIGNGGSITGGGTIHADIDNAGSIAFPGVMLIVDGLISGNGTGISGGTLLLSHGGYTGAGTITAAMNVGAPCIITATGPLSLGNPATSFSVIGSGLYRCGPHTVTLRSASAVELGSIELRGGRLVAPGEMRLTSFSGLIRGTGTIQAASVAMLGLAQFMDPSGVDPNDRTGLITFQSNLFLGAGESVILIDVVGDQPGDADAVFVSGVATLGGSIRVNVVSNLPPANGTSFTIFSSSRPLVGAFSDISVVGLARGGYRVIQRPLSIELRFCAADFNQDGEVNADDLGDFITCFFSTPPCNSGDFNLDGNTDPDDLGDFITLFFGPPC